jgi:hypothetical protein
MTQSRVFPCEFTMFSRRNLKPQVSPPSPAGGSPALASLNAFAERGFFFVVQQEDGRD